MARRILSEKQIVFHHSSLYEKVYILYNYSVLTIDESFTTSLYAIMHIYIDITTHSRNEWRLLLLYCLVTCYALDEPSRLAVWQPSLIQALSPSGHVRVTCMSLTYQVRTSSLQMNMQWLPDVCFEAFLAVL